MDPLDFTPRRRPQSPAWAALAGSVHLADTDTPPDTDSHPQAAAPSVSTDTPAVLAQSASPLTLTVIRADVPMTKGYGTAPDGSIRKDSEPALPGGVARRVDLEVGQPLGGQLRAVLESLSQREALILAPMRGVPPGTRDADVTTKANLSAVLSARERDGAARPVIARDKVHFGYPDAAPAVVGLDHDAKDLPADVLRRLEAAGGILDALRAVCPPLATATIVARPSVSTGVRSRRTGQTTQGGGWHVYIPILDGGDARRFALALHQRLILAGFGWAFVSKAGRVEVRSLLDVSACGVGERLWFEADAVLSSPDLEHVPGARAVLVQEGAALDSLTALPDLSSAEAERLRQLAADLERQAEPEAQRAREAFTAERTAKLVAAGVPEDRAHASIASALASAVLDSHQPVFLDSGPAVTVADILRDPARFHGLTGADPLEPDYGGGKNKAIIYCDGPEPRIFSQAHGRQHFTLAWAAGDVIAAAQAAREAGGDPASAVLALTRSAPVDPAAWPAVTAAIGLTPAAVAAADFRDMVRVRLTDTAAAMAVAGRPAVLSDDETEELAWASLSGLDGEVAAALSAAAACGLDSAAARQAVQARVQELQPGPQSPAGEQAADAGRSWTLLGPLTALPPVNLRREVTPYLTRGALTAMAAQPGVGKSSLSLVLSVAIAAERPDLLGLPALDWAGDVLVVSNEDDREEVTRRLTGILRQHQLRMADLRHDILLVPQDRDMGVLAKGTVTKGAAVPGPGYDPIRREVEARRAAGRSVALVIVDTLASAVRGIGESENEGMDAAMSLLGGLARDTDAAVLVIHHMPKGDESGGNIASFRGASAIIAKARVGITLRAVSAEDRKRWALPPAEADRWVCLEGAKANHGPKAKAQWFRREVVALPAADPRTPGQLAAEPVHVAVLVPHPTGPVPASVVPDPDTERAALRVLDRGDEDGRPFAVSRQAKNSAQGALAAALGISEQDAADLLRKMRDRVLIADEKRWKREGDRAQPVFVLTTAGREVLSDAAQAPEGGAG